MKFSFSYRAACACVIGLLMSGCASNPPAQTVSQKTATSQSAAGPTYAPYYQSQAYGPNLTTPHVQGPPVLSPPVTPAVPVVTAAPAPGLHGKIKVAILLPLTGKNAALGQAMLNAAQQAVFDAAGPNFELQPHDTATDGGAEAAAHAAAAGGAQLIIGPLFATDVPPVMSIAQSGGLQMLALSTDTSLAERGVYVMGLAPGAQVERVITYAAAHGARHFAALVPSTPYGALVGQTFQNAVTQSGGTIVDYETYDPATTPDAAERVRQLAAQRGQIDALFLPETGADLKTITDQLTSAGFDAIHTHMLGTGMWDVPGLGRQNPLLIGGWYAAPDPAARRNFIASYIAAYGQEPPRLATLAYDATALAAVLAKRNAPYDEASLTNPNGFAGLDGIFRLTASGQVERGMAALEVTQDGARVIDPAPTSFVARAAH